MTVDFVIDAQGHPRVRAAPPYHLLRWYLEGDVQSNAAWCDELQHLIAWVQADASVVGWEGTGNAFTLALSADRATLLPSWADGEPACELPLEEFSRVIAGWARFLRGNGLAPPAAHLHPPADSAAT
jgi:hypothetical protein